MNVSQHIAMLLACLLLLATVSGSGPSPQENIDKGEGSSDSEGATLEGQPEVASTYVILTTPGTLGEPINTDQGQVEQEETIIDEKDKRSSFSETGSSNRSRVQQTDGVGEKPLAFLKNFLSPRGPSNKPRGSTDGRKETSGSGSNSGVQMTQINTQTDNEEVSGGGTTITGDDLFGGRNREGEEFEEQRCCLCFKKRVSRRPGRAGIVQVRFEERSGEGLGVLPRPNQPGLNVVGYRHGSAPTPQRQRPPGSHHGPSQPSSLPQSGQPIGRGPQGPLTLMPMPRGTSVGVPADSESSSSSSSSPSLTPERASNRPFFPSTAVPFELPGPSTLVRGQTANSPTNSPPMTRTVLFNSSNNSSPGDSPRAFNTHRHISPASGNSGDIPEFPLPGRVVTAPEFEISFAPISSTSSSYSSSAAIPTNLGTRATIPHSYTTNS